jgi:SAM-dependent methyltransferase
MEHRMTNRSEWEGRTGNKWASEWRRTDRAFTGLTDRLLGRASERPFSRALDIGCGAGELTLALARGHPRARVTGIDISGELISVARERGAHLDNARFEVADAAHWFNSDFAPDLVVSRHGVMFFDEPIPAFANLAAGAGPEARLVFSCFRDRAHNPWATSIVALLPKGTVPPAAPDAPGPFAFADRSRVEHLLRSAGWGDSAFEKVDFAYVVGAGQDPVGDARSFFLSIGPAAAAAAELPGAERAEFIKRLEIFLEDQRDRDLIAFPAAAWIVSAQRA